MSEKTFMVMLAAAAAIAQTVPPSTPQTKPDTGSISGVVWNAGARTPLADVDAYANRGSSSRQAQATTDSQGRYVLGGLAPGQHRVTASGPSELSRGFGPSRTRLVALAAGQDLASIDFELRLHGQISGRIIDQNSEPVPEIAVFLVAREYSLGALRYVFASMARTDDRGEYVLNRVEPGRAYLVLAQKRRQQLDPISEAPANPRLRKLTPVATYYPGTTSVEGAQPLRPDPGERRERVDIRMLRAPSFCVEGALEAGSGPKSLRFEIADRQPSSGASGNGAMYIASPSGVSGPDGRVRICDLTPGDHQFSVLENPTAAGAYPAFFGRVQVTITDHDVGGITAAAPPRVPVPGEVAWSDTPPDSPDPSNLSIIIQPLTRAGWRGEVQSAKCSIPGRFSFDGMLVDEYSIRINGVPAGAYVKDITYGGRSIRHEPLRVGSAIGEGGLRIILARDGGTVSAKVADKDGNPLGEIGPNADVRVTLQPASID